MTHAHITTWVIALILFFVAISLHKNGKTRGLKVVQMILRLFYLLIIATGVGMLFSLRTISVFYWIKAILGVLVIGFFEMVLSKTIKGNATGVRWTGVVIALVGGVYCGVKLPLGF